MKTASQNNKNNFWIRKHTVQNNLHIWDEAYAWQSDGDEWSGQAIYCNQPYEKWKQSIIETFLKPNIFREATVLEIAPGHGRWTKAIEGLCKNLILVDLSQSCIEFCQNIFSNKTHIRYLVNDGKSLDGVEDDSVDFIWSFDSFVHMGGDIIESYFGEIRRALKPGGKALIHHPGRNHLFLWAGFLRNMGRAGRKLYKLMSMGKLHDNDGWRSDISKENIVKYAGRQGLVVEYQIQSWGRNHEFSLQKYGDFITALKKT